METIIPYDGILVFLFLSQPEIKPPIDSRRIKKHGAVTLRKIIQDIVV